MANISELLFTATQELRENGVPDARRDAGSLLAHAIGRDHTFLITRPEAIVSADDEQSFRQLVQQRGRGEPVQYLIGKQEFFGRDFAVTSAVLIPRPETELLVETALELISGNGEATLVCDVGTGSGCIAVSLLCERTRLAGVATDVSAEALAVAKRNAGVHGVAERLNLVLSDCLAAFKARAIFDLVVSNPPYVAENHIAGLQREVRDFEPRSALTPGGDGLSIIRRLLIEGQSAVKPGGHLLLEIGFDQHEKVAAMVQTSAWKLLDIHKDLRGIPRTVALKRI